MVDGLSSIVTIKSCRSPDARVTRLAQQKHTFFRILNERINGVFSKIWTQCNAMRAQILKRRPGICFRCGCNVTALGVQDHRDHRAHSIRFFLDRCDDLFEGDPPVRAEDFEKRRVGLECRCVARSLFNEIQAEVPRRRSGGSRLNH